MSACNDGEKRRSHSCLNNYPKILRFLPLHCIIHDEHLATKYFKYENVLKIVLQNVNLIFLKNSQLKKN